MNHPPPSARTATVEATADADKAKPLVVDSATLMDGRQELVIRHGNDFYRLRVTASNKLILTK
ncbi:MAG: hemin uptake protein HemP [Proteobacteria bacterium]|nr:hemin uptake protein HemP [Pseudomonadota bacterium]